MDNYDPETAPDPTVWLELDEGERLSLVSDYHEQAGDELPNLPLHATIHVVVENQLAEAYLPAVAALDRLVRDGLSRHDAVHAIGSLVAELIWDLTRDDATVAETATYEQALRTLTATGWRERFREPD